MRLSQLIESFVISNDEFEDYLDRATEQLVQELQAGKNARDAIHDLALTFADQHNKAYAAYVRMSDGLSARMHTLELNAPASADMGMEPDMGGEPEMMTDPMGDMEMSTPADSEMPSDSDMEDYAAVMDNEPEEVEESINEASCGCCDNDPCDCDDSCDCKKVDESGILYKAGVKKYGKEGMKKIQSASGKGASAEEIGRIKDQHRKNKTEAVVEGDDKPYICVHAKKGKHECHAKSSYEAAKKAAAHWKMKSTAGIDAHLAVEETAPASISQAMIAQRIKERQGKKSESVVEGAIDSLRSIVDKKSAKSIKFDDGSSKVDLFTASAIVQLYDAVNKDNKKKIEDLLTTKDGLVKIAKAAMSLVQNESVQESEEEIFEGRVANWALALLLGLGTYAGLEATSAKHTPLGQALEYAAEQGDKQASKLYKDIDGYVENNPEALVSWRQSNEKIFDKFDESAEFYFDNSELTEGALGDFADAVIKGQNRVGRAAHKTIDQVTDTRDAIGRFLSQMGDKPVVKKFMKGLQNQMQKKGGYGSLDNAERSAKK